jgi:Flp pilus assembly pilin Flp
MDRQRRACLSSELSTINHQPLTNELPARGARKGSGGMKGIFQTMGSWMEDESGASLVEYVMLAALIAVVCVAAVSLLGKSVKGKLEPPRAALSR